MAKRSAKLIAARAKAKREGWLDWVRCEADERAILEGYYFDRRLGDHVVEFGRKYLRHTEGSTWAGKPFELMEWQRERLFMPLFSWVWADPEWGRICRRFKSAYVQIPKKNGKSPTGAYVGLYMLAGDDEQGAKVFSAATSKDQASIVHSHAIAMVNASPELRRSLKVNKTTKRIIDDANNAYYAVLASSPNTNEGWNGHCCVADELHKWQGHELFNALRDMSASRAQPLFFMITTAGDDSESVCYEQYEYSKALLANLRYDPSYFPLIYEAEDDDDPGAEATWRKSNPSLGETVKVNDFRLTYERVKHSFRTLAKFEQRRLNKWKTGTSAWLNVAEWDGGRGQRALAI